jgi:hypothetical protein
MRGRVSQATRRPYPLTMINPQTSDPVRPALLPSTVGSCPEGGEVKARGRLR